MKHHEKLKRIDELQKEIDAQGELSADVKKKINYKFRLDWNFYSNSMEGNTLTMDETRSIMVGNLTVGGKPIKDVLEVKGHDNVVENILKMGKGVLRLSEKRIMQMHASIMHEEDEEKKAQIGIWKTIPNTIINYRKEKIDFALPSEVPAKMHDLLNRLNADIDSINAGKKNAPHPVEVALQFHLDYVTIHPFYDGNGRTARLLTNLILISFGYPPFWIKTEEKTSYYQYLADVQAYGGKPDLLFAYMANMIIRSQQLVIDATQGKVIDEPIDIDKKISLFAKELDGVDEDEEVKIAMSSDYLENLLDNWLGDLVLEAIPQLQKFNQFFTDTTHYVSLGYNYSASLQFVNDNPQDVKEKLREKFTQDVKDRIRSEAKFDITTRYGKFKKGGLKTFGCNYDIRIDFDEVKYAVFVDEFSQDGPKSSVLQFERLLHKEVTKAEITQLVKMLCDAIFNHLDYYTKKAGLR